MTTASDSVYLQVAILFILKNMHIPYSVFRVSKTEQSLPNTYVTSATHCSPKWDVAWICDNLPQNFKNAF